MAKAIIQGPDDPECLDVGLSMVMPYMWVEQKTKTFAGPFTEIMKIYSEYAGFCYRFIFPGDNLLGVQYPNGSFTGLIGGLVDGTYDIVGSAMALNPGRNEVVDFTPPINIAVNTAMIKYPTFETDIAGFIMTFNMEVWALVLVSILAVVIACTIIDIVYKSNYNRSSEKNEWGKSIEGGVSFTVRGLFGQDIDVLSKFGFSVGGLWLLVSVFVIAFYKSNLKAKLIAPKISLPFDDLEGFSTSHIRPLIAQDSTFQFLLKGYAPETILGTIYSRSFFSVDVPLVGRMVASGTHALIFHDMSIDWFLHRYFQLTKQCVFYQVRTIQILPQPIAVGLAKGNPYSKRIKQGTTRLVEGGIIQHLSKEAVSKAYLCKNPEKQEVVLKPLALESFYGIMMAYAGGISVSFLAFIVEIVFSFCHK